MLHLVFSYTALANPPESLKTGNYGHPPNPIWWLKQCLIYFLGLLGMKFVVFVLFQLLPWLGWVGDWALRWTEGKEWVQITFVMLIFPLIMNAAQYWIIDNFIKDTAGDYGEVSSGGHETEQDEHEGLIGRQRSSEDDEGGRLTAPEGGNVGHDHAASARTKEPNPTPMPLEIHSDSDDEAI